MKSKLLLTTSIFTLSILYGCLDEVSEASAPDLSELACKTEPLDDDSGLKIICGGDSVGVVLNGKDGKDGADGKDGEDGKSGADGKNGKDGKSCYATENAEINGYDVFCGDEKIGSIVNGKDGADGKNGENGANGKDGDKGDDGKDGKDGQDGKNGTDGKDGTSCTVEVNDDIDGYDVICGDKKVGEIHNGKDGQDGKNGTDGKDGTSCTVEENKEIDGYDVICGDKKVGQLLNGKDGENGKDGADGKDGNDGSSCTVEVNDDINGFDVVCAGKKVGELRNGKDGQDGKNGTDGKDGNDGSSCTVEVNDDINGFDVVCAGTKVGELRNGKDGDKGDDGKDGKDGQDGKNGTDGKDGTSCTVEENKEIDGYDVICGDKKVGEIHNGKDGQDGKNGTDGKDGTSCTVEENKEIDGFDVICADKKVGELRNGKDGKDGKNGTDGKDGNDGTSCRVEVNKEINGYDVICGDKKVGQLLNGKDGADGKNGIDGKDGTSCTVEENKEIDGYDVICAGKKVGELRNGKDAVLPSSSSIVSSSSAAPSSSSEISSSSETPSSSSVEQLSEMCKTLRATTDVFNSLYDVLGCTRSDEKIAIILRHAQRDIHKYGDDDGLIDVGRAQAKQVGEKLKKLNLDDFYYMYTNVKRTAETAQIIAVNKGENVSSNINDWHKHSIENLTEINQNLKESWYVKPNQSASNCKGNASWGWSSYSRIAYQEYDNDNNKRNCENAFYPIADRVNDFINTYFTYDQMHKYTLAISHDQYLVPFVVTISNKQIHDDVVNSKYDLRFHKHDSWPPDFNYWINYLTGVVLIVDSENNVIKLPVKALDDGFLREYKNP